MKNINDNRFIKGISIVVCVLSMLFIYICQNTQAQIQPPVLVQPSVGITSPINGVVSEEFGKVSVNGIGNLGLTVVVLVVDGNAYKTNTFNDTGFRFQTRFNWNPHVNGYHTLQATLYDSYGYVVNSDLVTVRKVD